MLIGNYTVRNKSPGRFFGGTSAAGGAEATARSNFGGTARRGVHYQDGESTAKKLWGAPNGGYGSVAWMMPYVQGNMVSHSKALGVAATSATIRQGRPIAGAAAGVATATAIGQLVVSGTATVAGVATVTGNLKAALGATGSAAGVATASATISATAWATGAAAGVATTSGVRYATGRLVGSIAPAITLDASAFATYLLDEEDVESGLTLRQALRLIAAATAGKVSGANGTTIVIRNAVNDDTDRITATVDSYGNRSAITYNLAA